MQFLLLMTILMLLLYSGAVKFCGARGREAKAGIGITLQVAPHQRDGTKAPISSGEGAWWYFRVPVAWAAPSVCVIKGKTINMELDSTGPTALKVTDSPLLRLVRAMVWYKQHRHQQLLLCVLLLWQGGWLFVSKWSSLGQRPWCSDAAVCCSCVLFMLGRTGAGERCGRWITVCQIERNKVGGSDWTYLCAKHTHRRIHFNVQTNKHTEIGQGSIC